MKPPNLQDMISVNHTEVSLENYVKKRLFQDQDSDIRNGTVEDRNRNFKLAYFDHQRSQTVQKDDHRSPSDLPEAVAMSCTPKIGGNIAARLDYKAID